MKNMEPYAIESSVNSYGLTLFSALLSDLLVERCQLCSVLFLSYEYPPPGSLMHRVSDTPQPCSEQ